MFKLSSAGDLHLEQHEEGKGGSAGCRPCLLPLCLSPHCHLPSPEAPPGLRALGHRRSPHPWEACPPGSVCGLRELTPRPLSSRTPLHYAAANCHFHCIETLVTTGANVNETDDWGRTALHYAAASDMDRK